MYAEWGEIHSRRKLDGGVQRVEDEVFDSWLSQYSTLNITINSHADMVSRCGDAS